MIIAIYFGLMASPKLKERFRAFIEDDIFMKITAAAGTFEEDEAEEAQEVTHVTTKLTDEVRHQRERMLIGGLGWIRSSGVGCRSRVRSPCVHDRDHDRLLG